MAARDHLVHPDALAPHGRAEPLGQRRHLGRRARRVVPDDDRRAPAGHQQLGSGAHARGIWLRRPVQGRWRKRLDVGLLLEHVDRQADEHRPGRRVGGDLQRAVHDQRELVGALDLHAPLGERRGHGHQVVAEHRPPQPQPGVLLPRRHHEGGARLERVVEHPERIAQAGGHVDVDHADPPARLRVVAGGAERHALVQGHDVAQLRIVQQRVEDGALGRAGVAEDVLDPVAEETLHEDLLASHAGAPVVG